MNVAGYGTSHEPKPLWSPPDYSAGFPIGLRALGLLIFWCYPGFCIALQVVLWEVYDVESDVLYIPAASLLFGSLVVDAVHMAVIGNFS